MLYKERLSSIRERIGITQKELANKININVSHYAHCEREDEIFPLKHLNNICNYFNVSLDYILGFTEIKQYDNSKQDIDIVVSATRLKEFRKENKLTQEKLGQFFNASTSVIVHHENKRHILATPYLYMLCNKYHISADYLLGKIDNPKYLK
ncbi:MAG: helix-turn-helix domain-containing protein [Ruminococcus sp.]|nr:helix-turn-helix domain-containing protein [Ruminococcus sp.]